MLIPVKGVIDDIHFHETFPHYDIKIIKFYDNIAFLKENFFEGSFTLKYKTKPRKITIPSTISNVVDLESWITESTYRFSVESSFVVRDKASMVELFEQIQNYLIAKKLRETRDCMMRTLYQGKMKIQSKVEFSKGINRMFGNSLSDEDLERLNSWI
jgi:hypothetical protein